LAERKIYVSPVFGKKLKKIKPQQKNELDAAVLEILSDPDIGEKKVGGLAGVLVHKFKMNKQLTLLSYTYSATEINLLTFGSHENFYRELKQYRKG
jgi:mRNA interferase RelE/StbE